MQEEPFGSDVLDTMEFLSSVISQYIASHGRCIRDFRETKRKEEEKKKRAENKARKQQAKEGSNAMKTEQDDGDVNDSLRRANSRAAEFPSRSTVST